MVQFKIKENQMILLMFTAAILFRVLLLQYRYSIIFDEVNYLKLGIYGAQHGFKHALHPFWPPLYPVFIGLLAKVFHHYEWVTRLFTIVLQSLVIFPLYKMSKVFFNKNTAIAALVLWVFSPAVAFFSTYIFTESLYTLLSFWGVFLGWKVLQHDKPFLHSILLGILWGMAYLTRPEALGYLCIFGALLGVLIFFQMIMTKQVNWQYVLSGLLILITFVLMSTPYLIYLKRETGVWTISGKMESQKQGEAYALLRTDDESDRFRMVLDEDRPILIDQVWHQGTFVKNQKSSDVPAVKVSRSLILKKVAENIYQIWKDSLPRILTPVVFLLVFLGLLGSPWKKYQWKFNLYLLSFLGFFIFVLIPIFHITDRYFYPLFPILFIWAGNGSIYLYRWIKQSMNHLISKVMVLNVCVVVLFASVFLFGIFIPQLAPIVSRQPNAADLFSDPIEHKEVANWLNHYDKDAVVMSVFHPVDFYLGNYNIRKTVSLPDEYLDRALLYARKNGANYLLLNERYKSYFSKIDYLLEAETYPETLERVYQWDQIKNMKVLLFKINGLNENSPE